MQGTKIGGNLTIYSRFRPFNPLKARLTGTPVVHSAPPFMCTAAILKSERIQERPGERGGRIPGQDGRHPSQRHQSDLIGSRD
jgi:hypothetical protein